MSLLEDAKEIYERIRTFSDQDLLHRFVALREGILELREENISLREQLKRLEDAQSVQAKLVRKWNHYTMDSDPEGKLGMYCLTCWDYEKKLVNLLHGVNSTLHCNICKARSK